MPTCSQAKIITNLETDIHKRLIKISNENESNQNLENNEIAKISIISNFSKLSTNELDRRNSLKKNKVPNVNDFKILQEQQQFYNQNQIKLPSSNSFRNSRLKARRISIEETAYTNYDTNRKLPYINTDFNNSSKKESVPANFLFNSSYRFTGRNSLTMNQLKINSLRSELNIKNASSDGEEYDENASTCSDVNQSDKSSISLPDNISKPSLSEANLSRRNSLNYLINSSKKSNEYNQFLPISSKRNSIDESNKNERENARRYNSMSNSNFSYFPKLALEAINSDNKNSIENHTEQFEAEKKISIDHAKRLLALASIRPSKTFHKSMTEEEIEVLKKYYEIIKPKNSLSNNLNRDQDKEKYENLTPLVYNSSKINFISLQNVKNFIDTYKKDIDSGLLKIDYDTLNDPKGFILKNNLNESVIKFPDDINDTFFALAISSSVKENQPLCEANLFRILNWNDTFVSNLNPKKSANNLNLENSNSSSPTSSRVSFEYIKNLTSLVNSVIESKLLKQLSHSAVDASVLPGGVNFEMPTFEELGIDLNTLLNTNGSTANGELPSISNQNTQSHQNLKLKNTAYKKLKDKISKARVMWFSGPPERKPLSVIFEYAGVDMGHETILDEANQYLKQVGGHVESLEFVPRSVLLNSVYVENLWILTLNDASTKFFTITSGLKIKDETVTVKSYDEFIFTEFENFIRNEKYKQLIKNHEKAIQNLNRKQSKKSSNN